jgi:hypothetical protein
MGIMWYTRIFFEIPSYISQKNKNALKKPMNTQILYKILIK